MQNEKTNIDFLRDIINAEEFNKEEALEFLDAINEEIDELNNETIVNLKYELSSAETKIDELETEIENLQEEEFAEKIECGIGTIEWKADNLQLIAIMESLEEKIQSSSPISVLQELQTIHA